MDQVRQVIKVAIPEASEEDIIKLIQQLTSLGVRTYRDLRYVVESDISGCLKPVQTRILLDHIRPHFKCGGCRRRRISSSSLAVAAAAQNKSKCWKRRTRFGSNHMPTTQPETGDVKQETEFAAKLRRHHDVLCELMEPDFGLVDHMYSYGILSALAADEINSVQSSYGRNEIILQNIIDCDNRDKQESFCRALTHCRQEHIVNFINADGAVDKSCGDERPLSKKHVARLQCNRPALVEALDWSGGLLNYLEKHRCITWRQKVELKRSGISSCQRSQELLDILRRGSVGTYKRFLWCLHETNQSHIADIIQHGGAVVALDAKLNANNICGAGKDLKVIENKIVLRLKRILAEQSAEDTDSNEGVNAVRLELARLLVDKIELVGARTQNSIGLTFYCRTSTSLRRLIRLFETGTLRAIVSAIFNALLVKNSIDISVYELAWHETVLQQALKHFDATGEFTQHYGATDVKQIYFDATDSSAAGCDSGSNTDVRLPQTSLLEFPVEMSELVLLKAAFKLWTYLWTTDPRPNSRVSHTLALVCYDWFVFLIERKWVKRHLRKHLKAFCHPVRYRTGLLQVLSTDGHPVWGVASLDSRIYVVCCDSNAVKVFDGVRPFGLVDNIVVSGLRGAWDLVACHVHRCLYLSDFKTSCVWNIDARHQTVTRWLEGIVWPFTMWVADDGRVLMINGEPPRLDIRSPTGEVLSSVQLPADMLFPLHAVEVAVKQLSADGCVNSDVWYMVSHGRTDEHLHRVCKLSADGTMLRSYGSKPGDAVGQLNGPGHLAIVSDVSRPLLVVGEYHSSRVMMFDAQLRPLRLLVHLGHSTGDVQRPRRLCVVPETGLLLVGLAGDGGVEVHSLLAGCQRTSVDVVKTDEMLAAEQQQLLDQLSNTSDIKLRRLLDITQQLGQTSLMVPLTKRKTNSKPATTHEQRSMTIHELSAH